jgi:hypothetical protein
MSHLWAILRILAATLPVLFGMSSGGVAQPLDPQPRAQSSEDGPPPGGCNPIGVTASGDIVFPLTCKDFLERYKAADRASSAAETKPATAEPSKAPTAVEADKAATTAEASKAPTAMEADKAPTTAEASKAPTAVEADKAPTTSGANKAPTMADPRKPDEEDAKPAAAQAPADEAAPPAIKQATVAPAHTVNSSVEPATTAAVSKRTRARSGFAGSPGCTRFRTYDAASGTYRDYGGRRRSCP